HIRCGILACGVMARGFAPAIARWCHLLDVPFKPVLAGICDTNPALFGWYQQHFPTIQIATKEYADLLKSPEINAIYCAPPHNLHQKVYPDILRAGKHLLGEKPFGIDLPAATALVDETRKHPQSF